MKKLLITFLCFPFIIFAQNSEKKSSQEEFKTIQIKDEMPNMDDKLKSVNGLSYSLKNISEKNGLIVLFTCNTCPFVVKWEDRYKLLEELISNNSIQYAYTIKPHPNFIVKSDDYPLLNLEVTMQPLVEIFNEFDIIFCGNLTSASLDAYLSGSPVIITFDPKTLNFSPLRGNDDILFVSNTEELRLALENSLTSKTIKPNIDDFFCLSEKLLNWDKLLS